MTDSYSNTTEGDVLVIVASVKAGRVEPGPGWEPVNPPSRLRQFWNRLRGKPTDWTFVKPSPPQEKGR